jgi:integrase
MRDDDLVDGAVRWSQHKTGDPHVRPLSPACMAAVREMLAHSPDGRILGWAMQANSARRRMRRYLRSLGLSGSSKWLRRSGATHIEMDAPGKGRLHLGHRTHGLAERCYIDWSQVRKDIPQVPSLLRE